MKIKNNLIYSFIFTILLTGFIIWNRLFRKRLPRDINYHEIWTSYDSIITVIFFLYFSAFCYYFLKYFKIIPRPNSKFKIIRDKFLHYLESKTIVIRFMSFYEEHVTNGPSKVYDYFYVFVYVKPFIWYCGQFLHKHFQLNAIIPYFLGFILPKIIVVIVLFIDIYFLNRIYYFYISLLLYLIPLFFKIILYMIEHHTKRTLGNYNSYFTFNRVDEWDNIEIIHKQFVDPIKVEYQTNLLPYVEKNWLPLQYMYSVVAKIYQEKHKYEYLSSMIIYGLYTISFGIYILKIIGFIL